MNIMMIANDTNFAWNLRKEILEEFVNNGWETTLLAHVLDFRDEFEKLGVRLINVSIDRRGTNPLSDLKLFYEYIKILKRERPDIVFTNNTKPNIYAGMACQLLGIKYIANITGLGTAVENPGKLQIPSIILYRRGVRKANTLFFQNSDNQRFFHRHHMIPVETREVLLPGSGVNIDTHPILPWTDESVHFLYAARIMKEKGIDYFLAAAREYAQENVVFDICGQCDDPKYASILKTETSVSYHGLQRDMLPFYQKCSCFLYPSYYPEGMSNVLLEAASCGRPVIAADRPGCRETVEDGISGFLVPIKNEEAVLSAVDRVLKMTVDERKKMGLAGRAKIEREFDRKIVVDAYLDEVERIKMVVNKVN